MNQKLSEIRKTLKQQLFNQPLPLRSSISDSQSSCSSTNKSQKEEGLEKKFVQNYRLGKLIGQGAHGLVYKCFKIDQPQTVYAVKKILRINDPEIVNTIIATFNLNQQLNDLQFIIAAYELFIDENEQVAYWVMEYSNWQSLDTYEELDQETLVQITKQIGIALDAIHKRGICHRDIKPDNILVDIFNLQIKIIDLGVSKKFQNHHKIREMWTRTGTTLFQAPEIFLGCSYTHKIDMWALGVILYKLLCRKYPFFGETLLTTIDLITNAELKNNEEFLQLDFLQQDLLRRMLHKDPEKRLSAQDMITHPWLQEIQMNKTRSSGSLSCLYDTSDQVLTMKNLDHFKNYKREFSSNQFVEIGKNVHYTHKEVKAFGFFSQTTVKLFGKI